MRRRLIRTLAVPPVAFAALAALVGCSSGGSSQGAASASSSGVPALHNALPQSIKDAGVIRFAGDSHPPYRVVAAGGKTVTGIDKDFQDALGKVLGVRTQTEIVGVCPPPFRECWRTAMTRSTARSRPLPSGRSSSTRSPG